MRLIPKSSPKAKAIAIFYTSTSGRNCVDKLVTYRVLFRKEPEGGYTATVPTLPGCISFGADLDEAKGMIREAIDLYIETLVAHEREVPTEEEKLEYNLQVEISA